MGLRLLGVQLSSGLMFRDVLLMGLGAGGTDRSSGGGAGPGGGAGRGRGRRRAPSRCASGTYGFGGIGACGFGGTSMWEVQVCACCTLYMTPHVAIIARFKA